MTVPSPDALLLLAPGCPHCPTVLEGLNRLVKTGEIATLEVVNIAARPERARALGVRSVPWVRIGDFTFEGVQSPEQLSRWAALADTDEGVRAYVATGLKDGALGRLETLLHQHPHWLAALLPMLTAPDTEMHVRIGISALMESFAGSAALQALVPALGALSTHASQQVRSDACHYLALSGSTAAIPYLRARLQDEHEEVREIARDGLDALAAEP